MAIVITIDGTPGNALSVPIGVEVTLGEQAGFVGASVVQWSLTRPPTSAATLTTPGSIGAAPWENAFTPDVPGDCRVRLVVTYANGSTAEASVVVAVALPQVTGAQILPAPSENTEREADTGWADGVASGLALALDIQGPAEWVVVLNDSGGPMTAGSVVWVHALSRFADLTGGTPVHGAPLDYVASAEAVPVGMPVFLPDAIADGARGRALRRGVVPYSPAVFGATSGVQALYMPADRLTPRVLTTSPTHVRAGWCAAGSPTAASAGWLLFDPAALLRGGYGYALLADNSGVPSPVNATDLVFDAATVAGFTIKYRLTRGAHVTQIGWFTAACDANGVTGYNATSAASTASGVTFSAAVAGGHLGMGYVTTATGHDAELVYTIEEVWAR